MKELLVNCRNGATVLREVPDNRVPPQRELRELLITDADRALARLRLRATEDPVIADLLTVLGLAR